MEPFEKLQEIVRVCFLYKKMDRFQIHQQVNVMIATKGYKLEQDTMAFVVEELKKYQTPEANIYLKDVRNDEPISDPDQGEEWESTLNFVLKERCQRIGDFLCETGNFYTRAQIEIGAGYRQAGVMLPYDEYKKLERRIQRDLAKMIKDGDVERTTKPAKEHKKGQNDDIYLYRLNPALIEATPDTVVIPPEVKKLLTEALAAYDDQDIDVLRKHLTAVVALVA